MTEPVHGEHEVAPDPRWFDSEDFAPIEYEPDGAGDYIDEMMGELVRRDDEMRGAVLSSAWSRGRTKKTDPEAVVFDLLEIKETVANLLKIHGLPKGTSIQLALLGNAGKGLAGFGSVDATPDGEEVRMFEYPYMYLDKAIYDTCEPHEVLDVYCGVGLHEASHLNHTREMFKRMKAGKLKGNRKIWEGLFEDERIEEKVREESPGYSPYLHAAKRALFEKKEFGECMGKWDEAPDLDKVMMLIFGVIRIPYLLTEEQKKWRTLEGECIYDTLRGLFPEIPKTEAQVEENGEKLEKFWNRVFGEYKKLVDEFDGEMPGDPIDSGMMGEMKDGGSAGATDCTGEGSPDEGESKAMGGTDGDGSHRDAGTSGASDSEEDASAGGSPEPSEEEGERPEEETSEGGSPGEEEEPKEIGDGHDKPSEDGEGDGSSSEDEGHSAGEEDEAEAKGTEGPKEDEKEDEGLSEAEIRERHARLAKQKEADAEDKAHKDLSDAIGKALDEVAEKLKAELDTTEKVSEAVKESPDVMKEMKKAEEMRERMKAELEEMGKDREGRRFSIIDLIKMIARLEESTTPLDLEETEKTAEVTEEELEFAEEWKSPDERGHRAMPRRTVIIHPKPSESNKRKYKKGLELVRPHVNRMRNVFRLRLGTREYQETERTEGKLHRRMLARAMSTDRLFYEKYTKTDKGIAICLLLDESGSMGVCDEDCNPHWRSRAVIAFQVAMLYKEALRSIPGIELEIYSYASCGPAEKDCLIKYLYGRRNKHDAGIAGYGDGAQNYDHIAIKTAGDLFIKNTENENRLMIVVSDGAPCGHAYGGPAAIEATRKAVEENEKRHIAMLNVAITDFASESMFKNVLKFLDLPDLINKMRRLLVRVIKTTTEGR